MPAVPGGRQCERCACRVADTTTVTEPELHRILDGASASRTCVRISRDGDRLRLATGLAAGIVALVLAGCATLGPEAYGSVAGADFMQVEDGPPGQIVGVVRDTAGQPIEDAIVILQSVAVEQQFERMTGPSGVYRFQELPPGDYTVQVFAGRANVSKIVELEADPDAERVLSRSSARVNFRISPEAQNESILVGMLISAPSLPMDASSTYSSSLVWIQD